jgi:hypothetical protein
MHAHFEDSNRNDEVATLRMRLSKPPCSMPEYKTGL